MRVSGGVMVMMSNSHHWELPPPGQPNSFYFIATRLECGNDRERDHEVMCK